MVHIPWYNHGCTMEDIIKELVKWRGHQKHRKTIDTLLHYSHALLVMSETCMYTLVSSTDLTVKSYSHHFRFSSTQRNSMSLSSYYNDKTSAKILKVTKIFRNEYLITTPTAKHI